MFPDLPVKSKEWYTFFNKRVTFTEITEQVTLFKMDCQSITFSLF